MKYTRTALPGLVFLGVIFLIIRGSYYLLSPMPFLFGLTSFLSLLYYLYFLISGRLFKDHRQGHEMLSMAARRMSVIFLLVIFVVSLRVVKDYQLPAGKTPYYSNSDNHGIRNEAIAFKGALTLYADKMDTAAGIRPSENGYLSVTGRGDRTQLGFKEFYTPVFVSSPENGRERSYLLNPQFSAPLTAGYTVSEGTDTLRFTLARQSQGGWISRVKRGFFNEDEDTYDIDFTFRTTDAGDAGDNGQPVTDSFSIRELTLRQGLGILDMIMRESDSVKLKNSLRLQRWLSRFSSMAVIVGKDAAGSRTLNLFLSKDAFDAGIQVHLNGQLIIPSPSSNRTFDMMDRFFVGLGNIRDSFCVAQVDSGLLFSNTTFTHVLRQGNFAYRKFSEFSKEARHIGTDEVRFLSNAPGDVSSFHLREGLLFHESAKRNPLTSLRQGVLHFVNGPPGSPLKWDIWPKYEHDEADVESGRFLLHSVNDEIAWVYSIRDFSLNAFGHTHMRVYLGIIMALILLVILLFPTPISHDGTITRSILPIETPVWMMVYALLTYRLLLLWRVATFPPVEGISAHEFGTLQLFDMRISGVGMPLPMTVLIFAIFIFGLWLHRGGLWSRWIHSLQARLRQPIFLSRLHIPPCLKTNGSWHFLVLAGAFILKYMVPVEILTRILELLVPLVSHFYFTSKAIAAQGLRQPVPEGARGGWSIRSLFHHWIDDLQEFLISLTTFVFLALQDRGFAVIFIVFLILKNIFLRFSRKISPSIRAEGLLQLLTKPAYQRIYGIMALVGFVLFLTWKGLPDFLLQNRRFVAILVLLIFGYFSRLVFQSKRLLSASIGISFIVFAVLLVVPMTWGWIDTRVQNQLRHVKYRASLIHKPVQEVLQNEAYGSGAERKIIETAQNQWFIHTYLDHAEQFPRRIGFQPHFRTGVDYSTQTRDVVLPRYVIAEFGYFTMFGLIFLITMPLLAYLFFFQLNDTKRRTDAESVTGLLALTFIFITALVVWMSSTNRFVFFGQDFPFLSLTSRLSVVMPLTLLFFLLTRNPICRENSRESVRNRLTVILFFSGLIIAMVVTGRKTNLLRDSHFQPKMDEIRDRIDGKVNRFFEDAQRKRKVPGSSLDEGNKDAIIGGWLLDMTKFDAFLKLYDSLSRYEKSMIDALVAKPAMGFDLRSPIHLIRTDGFFQMRFNNWFHLELPFYESDKVWRGDLYQRISEDGILTRNPPSGIARYIQQLPPGYFKPGEKPFAMIDLHNLGTIISPEVKLYRPREKVLKDVELSGFAERIDIDDLLLFRFNDQEGNINSHQKLQSWNLSDGNRKYFAFNAMVNGRRRMLYPMAGLFPWIREWANTGRFHMEQRGGSWLDSSIVINLDYDLTSSASSFLHSSLMNPPTKERGVLISVIAADSEGRIRLMTDHLVRNSRSPIDPNSQAEIDKLQKEQYFKRDPDAERYQWGNANLLRMRDGPGSSIKPVVFAAVSSQRNLEWEKLEFSEKNRDLLKVNPKGDGILVEEYAGMNLKKEGLKWPEGLTSREPSDLGTYMTWSRNLHHSLIVFLGSYTRADFPRGTLRDQLKAAGVKPGFPVIGLDGAKYTLRPSPQWPLEPVSGSTFGNSNSLMAVGLSEIFGLKTQSSFSSGRLAERTNCSTLPDMLIDRNVWAFPEGSVFDQAERTGRFSSAVIQTTLGGGVFRVTPLHMLQMYGRLFNHDQGYRASIDSVTGTPRSWVNLNPNDWSAAAFDQFLDYGRGGRKGLLESMKSVVEKGTAKYVKIACHKPGYSLYAKTGTTGNAVQNYSSKRLFVAIVKDDPGGIPVDFKSKRKFFVYITLDKAYKGDKENPWYQAIFTNIINRVMESRSFKEFMR